MYHLYPGCEILAQETKTEGHVEKWLELLDGKRYHGWAWKILIFVCQISPVRCPATFFDFIVTYQILQITGTLVNRDKVTKVERERERQRAYTIKARALLREDSDHTDAGLKLLPLIDIDKSNHFVKLCKHS